MKKIVRWTKKKSDVSASEISNIKLVILDRDGVINKDSPNFIKTPEEWHPIPGSLEAIKQLNDEGYQVAIATNQSGIARGLLTQETLNAIHQKLTIELQAVGGKIDHLAYCPHHPDDHCPCRKPKPALLEQCSEQLSIPLSQAIMIGDSKKDLLAAKAAGCHAGLVLTGNGMNTLKELPFPVAKASNLAEFVNKFREGFLLKT